MLSACRQTSLEELSSTKNKENSAFASTLSEELDVSPAQTNRNLANAPKFTASGLGLEVSSLISAYPIQPNGSPELILGRDASGALNWYPNSSLTSSTSQGGLQNNGGINQSPLLRLTQAYSITDVIDANQACSELGSEYIVATPVEFLLLAHFNKPLKGLTTVVRTTESASGAYDSLCLSGGTTEYNYVSRPKDELLNPVTGYACMGSDRTAGYSLLKEFRYACIHKNSPILAQNYVPEQIAVASDVCAAGTKLASIWDVQNYSGNLLENPNAPLYMTQPKHRFFTSELKKQSSTTYDAYVIGSDRGYISLNEKIITLGGLVNTSSNCSNPDTNASCINQNTKVSVVCIK